MLPHKPAGFLILGAASPWPYFFSMAHFRFLCWVLLRAPRLHSGTCSGVWGALRTGSRAQPSAAHSALDLPDKFTEVTSVDNEERPCACLKRTTVETCEVRRRLTEAEKLESEPIVIVGMGCRFSGGIASPEDLWRVLEVGGNETMDFAVDRQWPVDLCDPEPGEPWASCTHRGGFLHDVSGFDPTVPGIGSREALTMDTRQRPLLLTFCEAFERAGIVPTSLRGSTTGDFLGIVCDYSSRLGGAPDEVVCYLSSRTANSGVSGHLSYLLGLQGPAITACSSSLVALHRAVLSLRRGESSRALAGGATVMQTTESLVQFSTQRGMSADSRCKAFAATADGTGFSEGAAVVVAERVSDALRHGHPVLALVRGSAVNQECAVNGMTAPNGMAQQRVIGEALRNAGLTAGQADMVGVQGTGTPLGDPIEAQALRAAYGRGRPAERPLLLGSLKSNVGLTQAPVDVADVIKSVSAIQRGTIPRTLHIDEPTPMPIGPSAACGRPPRPCRGLSPEAPGGQGRLASV